MKRYTFYGFYNYDKSFMFSYNRIDTEVIYVSLLDNNENLKYGVQKTLTSLLQIGVVPSQLGFDIIALAELVYLADTRVSRDADSQDSWTREFTLVVPVSKKPIWDQTKNQLKRLLTFLTGDIWEVEFYKNELNIDKLTSKTKKVDPKIEYDTVSLFSGGMDSLIFTINSLQAKKKPILISHAGDGYTKNYQQEIIESLKNEYGDSEYSQIDLWMSFRKDMVKQSHSENTTRSRSFLFISLGLFAMSGLPKVSKLDVPENGLIALNVPLDELRLGSQSTRTTHPYYFKLWNEILNTLGLNKSIGNPYWNKTKGEMALECANKELLLELVPKSISCSSPTKGRWKKLPPQHCGHCVPCIIRRAAIHHAFSVTNDETVYTILDLDSLKKMHTTDTGAQLRSFEFAIKKLGANPQIAEFLIHKAGPLDNNSEYLRELSEVYKRGLYEVRSFLNHYKED